MKCENRTCGSNVNGWCQFEAEGDERPSFCSLNSLVGLLEKAQKLNEIVEGLRSVRWNNEGFRLKDTREWCEFYVALKQAEREQANNH